MKTNLWTRILSIALAIALCFTMMPTLHLGASAADSPYLDAGTEYYLPMNDLTGTSGYGGTGIYGNFNDTHEGGSTATNPVMLLQHAGDFVEYSFDMEDSLSAVTLKLAITGGKVEVKPAGGEFTALTPKNGTGFNRGTAIYTLDGTNALGADGNKFTLRISSSGETVILNGLLLQGAPKAITGTTSIPMLGEGFLKAIDTVSATAGRYFLGGNQPTLFLHSGESAIFRIQVAEDASSTKLEYTQAGNPLTAHISADGSTWTALASGDSVTEHALYIRFTADSGDAFLSGITVAPTLSSYTDIGTGIYLPMNDLAGTGSYGGTGIYGNFTDSFTGGDGTVVNPTMLLQAAGDFVEYNFDMDDSLTNATMKLAITGGKVEVKPAGGEFITLTPKNGSGFNRGTAIYELNESNALAASGNKFTLRISFDGATVILNGMLIHSDVVQVSSTVTVSALGEGFLRALHDVSGGASRYFLNGNKPTLFLHNGEAAVFHLQVSEEAAAAKIDFTQAGNALTMEVSGDGSSWTALSSGGETKLKDLYVRFTASSGDAFLQNLTVTPLAPSYTDIGSGIFLPVSDLTGTSNYGGAGIYGNFNDTYLGGDGNTVSNPVLLLQQAGDFIEYNFDMDDALTSALLKLAITGGKVEVKPAGGQFVTLTPSNGSAFDRGTAIYTLDETNALAADGNKFTLRISSSGETVILNGLLIGTGLVQVVGSHSIPMLGEGFLQALHSVSGSASRYFLDGNKPTLFLHNGESAVFHVRIEDAAASAKIDFTQAGNALTMEVSSDGSSWTALSSGGETKLKDLYVRFTASSGDAFLSGITVSTVAPSYTDIGSGIFLPVSDLTGTSNYGGAGIYGNFNDTYLGGDGNTVSNPVLLLQQAGDFIEYNFDMDDALTSALLKLAITGGKVEVKPAGGEFVLLSPSNGSAFDRGTAIYTLDEANALAADSNKFTLRISSSGETVILNGLLIHTDSVGLSDTATVPMQGEAFLRALHNVSGTASRYFLDGNKPTLFLHNSESAVFHFVNTNGEARGMQVAFTQAGNALTMEVSADGSSWSALAAGGEVTAKDFFLRFTASSGDAFLSGITLTPTYEVIEEKEYIYLDISDLTSANRYGGAPVENFLDTFLDGNSSTLVNPTLLLQTVSDYVEYDVNLPDGLTSAILKIYMKHGVVSVRPKGGEFITLTAKNGSGFDRNVAIYELTEADALAAGENQFTVRISCDGSNAVVINALMVHAALPEISGEYTLDLLGESYLQRLHDITASATRYFANGNQPTVFLRNGETLVLHFDFADDVQSLIYSYVNLGQPLTAKISYDGTNWVALPAGGRIEDALALNEGRSFYISFTANAGESFLQALTLTPAEPEIQVENDYVYLPIKDLSNADSYAGSGIYGDFEDTFTGGEGGKTNNLTLLLQTPEDYVEYKFNLTDSRTTALLKVYMTDAEVYVKPDGGEFVKLTAKNDDGGSFNRGVAIFQLTEQDALANPNRKFTVRICAKGSATAVLNGLVMDAADASFENGSYSLKPLGESFLQGIYDASQDTSRYFHMSTVPTVFLKKDGYVTFRMNFKSGGACYLLNYESVGEPLTVEVSLNGRTWVPLKGQRVDKALNMSRTGTYYVRFTATKGESFLVGLNATRETKAPQQPVNSNPNAPKDVSHLFFLAGTSEEEKYMFGTGKDFLASFNATHTGMGIDGFEGGYSTALQPNARLFDNGYVIYEFDLADDLTAANLKVYGLGEMEFLISTDEGETYDALSTDLAPISNGRGYYIFRLDSSNALKGESNKFRLQIRGTYGVLIGLMIEAGAPELDASGLHFTVNSENSLQYLHSTKGLRSYYADTAFANYYLDEKTELVFRVPVGSALQDAILYATYCGDVTIAVATEENGPYTTLLTSALGATGTPHTNTFDISQYLSSGMLYIRISGSAAGAFVDSFGIATAPAQQASGTIEVFTDSEAAHLFSIDNNTQGIGNAKRVTVDLRKARGIDVGGSIVYRLDLPDDANGVDITLVADGKYEIAASIDGTTFLAGTELNAQTVRILEALDKSEDKVVYIRISNASASDDLILHSLTFTTEGIPSYERPDTPDFDYDDDVPGTLPNVDELEKPTEPDAIPGGKPSTPAGDNTWLWIGAGCAAAVVVLVIIILLLVRRRKDKKEHK